MVVGGGIFNLKFVTFAIFWRNWSWFWYSSLSSLLGARKKRFIKGERIEIDLFKYWANVRTRVCNFMNYTLNPLPWGKIIYLCGEGGRMINWTSISKFQWFVSVFPKKFIYSLLHRNNFPQCSSANKTLKNNSVGGLGRKYTTLCSRKIQIGTRSFIKTLFRLYSAQKLKRIILAYFISSTNPFYTNMYLICI